MEFSVVTILCTCIWLYICARTCTYTGWNEIRAICPVKFSFQEACHCQMAQAIKLLQCVLSSLHPFQGRQQCITWHSLEHALTCWHRPCHSYMKSWHKFLVSSWRAFRCPHRKKAIGVRSGDCGGHVIGLRRPVHHVSRSTTAGRLPYSALGPFRCRKHNLCLTARGRGTSLSSPCRTVSRKWQYRWSVRLSGNR
jgi:hypothetical protein